MAKGSERFRRGVDRDPQLEAALALVDYDTDKGRTATIGQRLKDTGNQFRVVFENTSPRCEGERTGGSARATLRWCCSEPLPAAALTMCAVRNCPPTRFASHNGDGYLRAAISSMDYNTDIAHKQTLATSVARSRKKYASMVSTTERFREAPTGGSGSHLGPGSTNPNPEAIEPHRPQPVLSTTARFPKHHDPSKNLGTTYRPQHDAKFWKKGGVLSQTPRPPMVVPSAVDKIFDVDSGHRMSLNTAMQQSPRRYANVRSRTSRNVAPIAFTANDPRLVSAQETCGSNLGPGAHEPQVMKNGFFNTISRRDDWDRATPSFASGTARFRNGMAGGGGATTAGGRAEGRGGAPRTPRSPRRPAGPSGAQARARHSARGRSPRSSAPASGNRKGKGGASPNARTRTR